MSIQNAEITTMRLVFGAQRKSINQLSESSEKKYEGVSGWWQQGVTHGNNMQGWKVPQPDGSYY